jgi:molybdate/tungstate transport system substrate-binding protein
MKRLLPARRTAALTWLSLGLAFVGCGEGSTTRGGAGSNVITVFNAGALALPLRQALDSFALGGTPGSALTANQESAGSVQTVRKVVDLGRTPDVVAVADTALFGSFLSGRLDGPVMTLGRTRLVLAYTDQSRFASEVNSANWAAVTTRPGVQVGRSDPNLDPAGYRALMAMQLAAKYYKQPDLGDRLRAAAPPADMRPKSADLTALLQTGNLDYAWEYESVARTLGLRYVVLPAEVDLGDPKLGSLYASVSVTLAQQSSQGGKQSSERPVTIRGAPIVFGAAVLKNAPNPAAARRFLAYLNSPAGRGILAANGLAQSVATPDRP